MPPGAVRSHRLGRLDHLRVNGQTVVDEEYLDAALSRFALRYVEMEPGDALVFHCNLLHRSDANTSDLPRWGYIASYNAVDNAPFRDVREYGRYQELQAGSGRQLHDRCGPRLSRVHCGADCGSIVHTSHGCGAEPGPGTCLTRRGRTAPRAATGTSG